MNKNYVGVILAVIGIVAGVLGYVVVWNQFSEKTDRLNTENAALGEEVAHLQDLADHKEEYIANTKAMKQENDEIIAQFPAEVKYEDEILYADQTEKNHLAGIKAISMPGSNVIEVQPPADAAPAEEAAAEETEGEDGEVVENTVTEAAPTTPSIMLYQTPVTISLDSPYSVLKDILGVITADKANKKSIDVMTMSFDEETGDLSGTVTYSMYSLTGTDKTYTSPSLPGVAVGTQDLFNTAERKAEILAEQAKQAATAAAAAAKAAAQ